MERLITLYMKILLPVELKDTLCYLLLVGFIFFLGLIIHLPFSHLIVRSFKSLAIRALISHIEDSDAS